MSPSGIERATLGLSAGYPDLAIGIYLYFHFEVFTQFHSFQVDGALANEIKHGHSPVVMVCRQSRKTFLLLYCLFFIKVCRQSRKTFLFLYYLFFLISFFLFLFYFFPTICVLRFLCHFSSDLSHIWPVGK